MTSEKALCEALGFVRVIRRIVSRMDGESWHRSARIIEKNCKRFIEANEKEVAG